tara:strand:- start:2178 stop:2924 length:747 start_codon:yes stop_codon:yes gene_type:complete
MNNFDFAIILTCTINPSNMPNVVRSNIATRLDDYKKSFNFWINNKNINKIIFIENSGYDLSYFRERAKAYPYKKTEILSSNLNNTFDKKLGKGYGEFLCLKEVFENSIIVRHTDYFLKITGRCRVNNFGSILKDVILSNTDIYANLSNNLKYIDASIFGGSKKFFSNYLLPELKKTNDTTNNFFENKVADATLKAISDGLILSKVPIYPDLKGYIGTNGKKRKQNIFKKIKLFFFRKLKIYFLNHKKY